MKSNYLIIDTEVKGVMLNRYAPFTDVENWPRIRQVSWLLLDSNLELIKIRDFFPTSESIKGTLKKLEGDIKEYNPIIVMHNVDFDKNVIGAELARSNQYNFLIRTKKICTMSDTVNYCKLGNSKYPTLQELYYKIFKTYFKGHHNSKNDILATKECFVYLKKEGFVFNILKETVQDHPETKEHVNDKKRARYQTWALLELLRIFQLMPHSLNINDQIDFLNDNYFSTNSHNQGIKIGGASQLSLAQNRFIMEEEEALLSVFKSNELYRYPENTMPGSRIAKHISFIKPENTKEELSAISKEFQFILIKYELVFRKHFKTSNIDNQIPEPKSSPNLTIVDVHEMLRMHLEKDKVNIKTAINIILGLYPKEIYPPYLDRPIENMEKEIDELIATLKVMEPLVFDSFDTYLINTFLIGLHEYVPEQIKLKLDSIKFEFIQKKILTSEQTSNENFFQRYWYLLLVIVIAISWGTYGAINWANKKDALSPVLGFFANFFVGAFIGNFIAALISKLSD